MAVRLNRVCRELNISLQTVCEFLEQHGYHYEHSTFTKIPDEQYRILIENFPNRISDEQHQILIKNDLQKPILIIPWNEDIFSFNSIKNREIINSHGWDRLRNDIFIDIPSRYILVPKDQKVNRLAYWTKIDFELNCKNALKGNQIVLEQLSEPSGYLPVIPCGDEKKYEIQHLEQENYRISKKVKLTTPKVLGSIDLNTLNSSTRPLKKEERRRQDNSITPIEQSKKRMYSFNQSSIKDIWQRFVDIQEKLIRQRCSPISIIPESIKVEDGKLYVTVDDSSKEQKINSLLKDKLELNSYDLSSGYLFVDESIWNALSESELEQIRKGLSECYVELDTTPYIDVIINYGCIVNRCDQLSLDELHQMDSMLKKENTIEGTIDDKAVFVSKVSMDKEGFMKYLFGEHYVTYTNNKKNHKKSQIIEHIEYHNEYLPWDVMRQYASIGLVCKKYTLIFRINNQKAKEKLRDCFDCYYPNTDTFEFNRDFTKKDPCHKNYVIEVNDNIHAFMDEAMIYCSNNDIEIDVLFVYAISGHQLINVKFSELGQYIKNKGEGYSFNENTGAIGIDFNWRTDNIDYVLSEIERNVPFVKVNVHDEHRFKCTVNSQMVGYNTLKKTLEEKYDDIDIKDDNVFHQIKIRLPYRDTEYYEHKRANLESDLLQLIVADTDIQFIEKVEGKVRLNVKYNYESMLEDLEDSIMEMRKADFGIMLDEKEISFGKLIKVNYPNLVFDIDLEEEKKTPIIEAFESKAVTTIIPVLTGELEKISRLKNTFSMATTGSDLINPRLQRFIFNSAEATKNQDVDFMLKTDGVVYKDLCEHLLNSKINESQKNAIIKAMYAEDLAVIQGPPGTGKSTAIAEMIWQLVRRGLQQGNKRERILLTSETNLAVDNAISRIVNDTTNLVKPVRFGGEEKLESEGLLFSFEMMKRWVEDGDSCFQGIETDEDSCDVIQNNLILKNWLANISSRSFYRTDDEENKVIKLWRNFLNHPSKELREIVYNRYIENVNVIGATCSSIGDKRAGGKQFNGFTPFFRNFCEVFKQKIGKARIEFTTVIQDESSKATPAELVLPFVYGQRAIVIGDHRQLPPMLDKEDFEDSLEYAQKIAVNNKEKEDIRKLRKFVEEHFEEMEISHFQKLYENIDSSLKGTFNMQYRMHPDINEVIEQFYREDGGLYCGLVNPIDLGVNDPDINNPASRYHGIDIPGLLDRNTHVLFIDTNSPEMKDGTSRVNYGEIETIDRLLVRFAKSESFKMYQNKFVKAEDKQIGIISFYGKQIKQLRNVANKHPSLPIRVSTVDRFQGMERNIVIVSMVRSNTIQSLKDQQPDWKRYPDLGYPKQESLGFAQSPNRLNVALSRAKRLLVIVGNRKLFSSLQIYQRLFLTIEANKNNMVIKQQEV